MSTQLPSQLSGLRRCWISIGSNQMREQALRAGVSALHRHFGRLLLSPVYESAAEGFDGDPFLNLVAGIETRLDVATLRRILRTIEDDNGRQRGGARFAPRPLDLDLLTWGDAVGEIDGYPLPRDEILRYAFVLGPLADVAPDERHPVEQSRYHELWAERAAHWPQLQPFPLDLTVSTGE
jgi:2-amino-4-hydroxy-6-hydroxymethyldihydropteridine diphosphokinase